MNSRSTSHRSELKLIARQAMLDRGLWPDFAPKVNAQVEELASWPLEDDPAIVDLTSLPWCSIDNDDSRDLDQLSVAEELGGDAVKIRIAIADVDALVKPRTPVDLHAANNTTSIYTGAAIFPMLPEQLSTDLTSLNKGEERLAVVTEFVVAGGVITNSAVYRARVKNKAQLAYNAVAAWIDGHGPLPGPIAMVPELDRQIRIQDTVAQCLRAARHEQGALELEITEPRAVFNGDTLTELRADGRNRAKELIEDFMIAANGVTARFLAARRLPSLRRVVRSPERWARIVMVARDLGDVLPPDPDARALGNFLVNRRHADPLRFPDLSLVIVKLMGAGEYVVETPGRPGPGHFGLAVRDYTHSTAPNRRYPDLITQRLLKTALAGAAPPYNEQELGALARHCTEKEDDANKVERQVRKSAAALLLESRHGERFDGVVTGASDKGTYVRVFHPPVDGKVMRGYEGLEVGDKVRVRLIATDVERGYIDFVIA